MHLPVLLLPALIIKCILCVINTWLTLERARVPDCVSLACGCMGIMCKWLSEVPAVDQLSQGVLGGLVGKPLDPTVRTWAAWVNICKGSNGRAALGRIRAGWPLAALHLGGLRGGVEVRVCACACVCNQPAAANNSTESLFEHNSSIYDNESCPVHCGARILKAKQHYSFSFRFLKTELNKLTAEINKQIINHTFTHKQNTSVFEPYLHHNCNVWAIPMDSKCFCTRKIMENMFTQNTGQRAGKFLH